MCRLAAYTGPTIRLEQFLLSPPHSLLVQSYAPQEMRTGRVNADGYGFGWQDEEGPARLAYPMPIWADTNLPTLARTLRSSVWLASVRGATSGFANHPANTQPFIADDLLFMHNGTIDDFPALRAALCRQLSPEIEASIHGNTDSEHIFALARQIHADGERDLRDVLAVLAERLADLPGLGRALLNIVLVSGNRIHALRLAWNEPAPSLYFTIDDEDFPGALLVASEALTNGSYWQAVPERHILTLDPDAPPELFPIS